MSQVAAIPAPIPVRIPVRQILPYAIFAGVLFLVVMYFVSTEQGALSLFSGTYLHELVHDGRHLLGFPCH
ncbi:MAG TPA: CbtB domain-containing protein [Actinophytocola sp.]|uniref:CbtB domain-containing protein n=1 Tax=Actinophytocola sp. TaxID=1872138 RepID=UPI002DDD8635|nr:CbtB domain-containing protein [Actinophytocola sp.]HEV2783976.1 CbtB domain-containing protein [Actinophytocola sp.]